jgi:hypothetical protein
LNFNLEFGTGAEAGSVTANFKMLMGIDGCWWMIVLWMLVDDVLWILVDDVLWMLVDDVLWMLVDDVLWMLMDDVLWMLVDVGG